MSLNDIKVLVVYSSGTGDLTENERLIDMLISHYTTNISFRSSDRIEQEDFDGVTHVFYYGGVEEKLAISLLSTVSNFKGEFFAIGHNANQFKRLLPSIEYQGLEEVSEFYFSNDRNNQFSVDSYLMLNVVIDSTQPYEIMAEAQKDNKTFPLLIKNGNNYYFATTKLYSPMSLILAEELHNFFNIEHKTTKQAYLRLEDVNPRMDASILMDIAEYLKEKKIPYMVSVVPVYLNPKTDEEYHLSDNEELVETLNFIQENGGSIIFHGYTDQYHTSKTGDGFEFWNKDQNMPIYQTPGEQMEIKQREDFVTNLEYANYMDELKEFEAAYIDERLKKGTRELLDYHLYPLAFESPHYAMSQNGYNVVSEIFSTLVGQIQLTDDNWKTMMETPYIAYPTFLNGQMLIPETIRYIRYNDPNSINEMKQFVQENSIVRDGVISGFYHPFLGKEGLVQLVKEIEKFPDVEWKDLKDMIHTVKLEDTYITTENGEIVMKNLDEKTESQRNSSSFHWFFDFNGQWLSIGVIGTILMMFISYIIFRRSQTA